jgi:hypothetical protein
MGECQLMNDPVAGTLVAKEFRSRRKCGFQRLNDRFGAIGEDVEVVYFEGDDPVSAADLVVLVVEVFDFSGLEGFLISVISSLCCTI